MTRLAMVIDLTRCVGCFGCVAACKCHNGTPKGVFWGKVLEKEIGTYPNAKRIFLPVLCNHCERPSCLDACPTGATYKRSDGIVAIDYDKCIGCRCCVMACPYDARTYVDEVSRYFPKALTPYEERQYAKWQEGTVTKCNFCPDRIEQGLKPICVTTCPSDAREFGDIEDPNSRVSQLVHERGGIPLLPEAGTGPSVYYLFKKAKGVT